MTEVYKLVAVNAISRDLNGHQISSPNSCDVLLNPATGTWIGRGVGAADFRIPIDWIMYSTRHCHITYDAEVRAQGQARCRWWLLALRLARQLQLERHPYPPMPAVPELGGE